MKRIVLGLGIMVLALVLFTQTASAAAAVESAPGGTAVVKAGAYTDLVSADGAKVSGLSVTLTPGEHTVVMKPSYPVDSYQFLGAYFFYSLVNGSVTFNAEPGHEYVAYIDTTAGPTSEENMGTGFSWVGYIKDKTANQRVAKTETLPLEAFPRSPGSGGGGVFMGHR